MSDQNKPASESKGAGGDERPGRIKRLWRWFRRPTARFSLGTLLIVGFAGGIVFWGGFNTFMEYTNTEKFCISCHEMRNYVYKEYRNSIHYNNRSGVRAVCADCHVPKEWIHKIGRKIMATNELYHKIMGTIDTKEKFEKRRLKLAKSVWKTMKETDSRECRNCHDLKYMDVTKQERRSRKRHRTAIKKNQTCIDCHKGIAHELPKGWDDG